AESAGDWIWEMGPDLRFTYLSGRFYELFPVEPAEIIGKTRDEFAGAGRGDHQWRRHLSDIANYEPFRDFEYSVTLADGATKYIRISGKPLFDGSGTFTGYRGTGTDVTVEVEARAAAEKAEARLFDAVESITAGLVLFDRDDRLVLYNSRYMDLHPILAELAVPGATFEEIVVGVAEAGVYDASMGPPEAYVRKRMELHRNAPSRHEQRLANGRVVDIHEYNTHDGGTVLLWTDTTERWLLERQLAGAQRMEALGKLTGGVAHDFNNLLTVILGNLQLMERRIGENPRLGKYVALASGAAQRGAELTTRLLAFARRQMLEATVFDVNSLVAGMEELLRGTLGETIQIEKGLAADAWPVRADPTQLENALLNLALNARDAMPEGGKVTIETVNVVFDDTYILQNPGAQRGDYVMVAIGDTGVGMEPEVLDHALEPFFTTKETGKGTGLGLSMVYGFAKQSGGYIKLYSEPGHGSVVKLYLPSPHRDERAAETGPAADHEVVGGDETILVVEDDADVRRTTVALLDELGYRVVEAEDGPSALRELDRHTEIDLLFTDVVMPGGMKGPDLADEVGRRRPDIRVLYMSGYTEYGALSDGMIEMSGMLLS
ncbi:MAG: PAS-domain containing protein, partial [Rhodospirillales bacterium]